MKSTWLSCPAANAQAPTPLVARGSVEQVHATDATPGARVKLLRRGTVVDVKRAGELGGVVFRRLDPGGGYRVRQVGAAATSNLRVLGPRPAPPRPGER